MIFKRSQSFYQAFLSLSAGFLLCCSAVAQSAPPRLFYSDLESGPNTGGQNNKGVFVTVWGKGFGSSRGSSTVTVGGGAVDNYPVWTDTEVSFQLGANAKTGNIAVKTGAGTSNSLPFTVRSGNIYFVSPTGSDGNSGSYTSPFSSAAQCKSSLSAGDVCYFRNGWKTNGIENYTAALIVMSDIGGSGSPGRPKALVVYPGESATIGALGVETGLRFSAYHGNISYWVVSGFNLRGDGAGALIEGIDNVRIVNTNCQTPNGNIAAACVESSQATNVKFFGNEVTNSGVSNATKLYHAVYFSTDSNHIEAAWNWIHNNNGCRGIQFHSSPLDSNSGYNQYDLSVHDNLIHDIRCDGINFATIDPSKGKVEAYNNVIYNTGKGPDPPDGSASYSCILVAGFTNNGSNGKGTINLFNNTLNNCGTGGTDRSSQGAVSSTVDPGMYVNLKDNLMQQPSGIAYIATGSNSGTISGDHNLYYGNGSGPSFTSNNVNANPLMVNVANHDYHLTSGSAAKDAGSSTTAAMDKDGVPRPSGASFDIGAYEYSQGQPQISPCDLNADGTTDDADVQISINQTLGIQACAGDLTQDGVCNVVDVQRVVNASLGQSCDVGP